MQKTVKINGNDVTSWTPKTGYVVQQKSVIANTITMMNGETYKDEIAVKTTVTVPFIPLTDAQLKSLMTWLYAGITCQLYFYDPYRGTYRTMVANRVLKSTKFRGKGSNNVFYWTGVEVEFEEK
jgi:hypothetical protein